MKNSNVKIIIPVILIAIFSSILTTVFLNKRSSQSSIESEFNTGTSTASLSPDLKQPQILTSDTTTTNNTQQSSSSTTSSNARNNVNNNDVINQLHASISELNLRISELETTISEIESSQNNEPSQEQAKEAKWFNMNAMMATGLSEAEILHLKERYEALEMEKLYLRDRAIRDDWINTSRYSDELDAIENGFQSFRDGINKNTYDSLLFATGKPNRVVIQDVMQNSPASIAGLKSGDHIISYNNTPIYSTYDLRHAITTGEAGEEIKIDINRNGSNNSVYLPRGPLGIRMESKSLQP